jgi:D-alanine-D-alanine ligase
VSYFFDTINDMSFAEKIRVGVLRGGPSAEYEISLKTGQAILDHLDSKYEPVDILVSRDGTWHEKGIEQSPVKILKHLDVVMNGLHGTYGEDGQVQKILEEFGIPYTGPRPLSATLSMNKVSAKNIYKNHSLKTPYSITIPFEKLDRQVIKEAYESLPGPYIVKPADSGSSIGVYFAQSLPELEEAIVASAQHSQNILVEEFIQGKEATCGVIENFRNQNHYTLLPIEIKHQKDFFDYQSKYNSTPKTVEVICPGNFSPAEIELIKQMTTEAHRALGLRHYSRSDFIVHPKRGIYILETNSLPGLTPTSSITQSLTAIGSNLKEFINHLLTQTLGKK